MAINDTAKKLAGEIKNSKEYKMFIKNMNTLKQDKESEKLLKEYRDIQGQVRNYAIKNQQLDKKMISKVNMVNKKVSDNKKICSYLDSELKFNKVMEDINKILAQAVINDYK